MPRIVRPKRTPKNYSTIPRDRRHVIYNDPMWKKVRTMKLQASPVCEICLQKGIVTSEELHVHHIISPFRKGITVEEQYRLAFSADNLQTVCRRCHAEIHALEASDKKAKP